MRILWHSNAPWVGSGYGNQTAIFCQLLVDAGHDVMIRAFYGLQGAPVHWGKIQVLPSGFHGFGEDVLQKDWQAYQPDVHIALVDTWIFAPSVLRSIPLTTWCPVDHDPLPPAVDGALRSFKHIWAMSRFGERKMREAGHDPFYVPHGVDMECYKPVNHQSARTAYGVEDDQLFVVSVAANTGLPSRKNLDRLLKAWSIFIKTHPRAYLWLHTEPQGVRQGLNLMDIADYYGITSKNIKFANPYLMQKGDYDEGWLNQLYNAADAFLLPSRGEGFGIPAVEAQAAGCPVIVCDFSAQSELGAAGYKIPIDPTDDLEYSYQNSEWAVPKVSEIIKSLEWAAVNKDKQTLRAQARDFAAEYDARKVLTKFMLPALESIAAAAQYYIQREPLVVKPAALEVEAVLAEPPQNGHVERAEAQSFGVRLG